MAGQYRVYPGEALTIRSLGLSEERQSEAERSAVEAAAVQGPEGVRGERTFLRTGAGDIAEGSRNPFFVFFFLG